MGNIKPSGSPDCWGRLHQDGEEECRQCRFRYDCKTETLYQINKPGARIPVFGPYVPPPVPPSRVPALPPPSSTIVPLPPKPSFPLQTPQSSYPPPARTIASNPQTTAPSTPTYQNSSGFSLPNPTAPNPLSSWYRPGAPGPAYHFTQYPNESVGSRLAKNAVLRALEAIFGELMQFFRHWTWPPHSK